MELIQQISNGDGAALDRFAAIDFPVAWHPHWPLRKRSSRGLLKLDNTLGKLGDSIPVEIAGIRALPGHFVVRLHMAGVALTAGLLNEILPSIQKTLKSQSRIARLETYVMAANESDLTDCEETLSRHGFVEALAGCFPITYRDSSLVDLSPGDDQLKQSISSRARRQISLVDKRPVNIIRIEDKDYGGVLKDLWAETLVRKNGKGAIVTDEPWSDIIDFSRNFPERSAIFGLESTEAPSGPNNLLSFIWATRSGPFAHYEEGASSSNSDARIGLAHAPMWEAIKWGKSQGAKWFDLTGVTGPNSNLSPSMVGVTEFKRQFNGRELQVRSDWAWNTKPVLFNTMNLAARAYRSSQKLLHIG